MVAYLIYFNSLNGNKYRIIVSFIYLNKHTESADRLAALFSNAALMQLFTRRCHSVRVCVYFFRVVSKMATKKTRLM